MENRADAPEPSKNATVSLFIFFIQSVVAAALFPVVLGSSGGDTVIAAWRLSPLLCLYFYSAVCALSSAPRRGKACLFVCLTYAVSMAFMVDAVLSHAAGTAIICLDSVWMACVFGHALAGATASSCEKFAPSSEEAREKIAREMGLTAFLVIVLAAFALSPVCIMDPDYAPEVVVTSLPLLLCPFITIAIICVLKPRPSQGAPAIVAILGVECDTTNVVFCSFISPFVLFMCSLFLVGEVGAAVVSWTCVIGLAVLLGYCLTLHASSACSIIDGWLSVRSEPKPKLLNKKQAAAVAAGLLEEQADAARGNKEQTVITIHDQVLDIE